MLSKLCTIGSKINRLETINNRLTLILLISAVTTFIKIASFYSLYSLGEIWFEEGYLYYGSVIKHGFLRSLTIADASYLNSLPKIISIILIKVFGVTSYFPYLFKIINIYVFCLSISFLLLKEFDEYFGSKLLRLIAVLLITLFPHYDMSNPANSSYSCIVPIMWFIIKFNSKSTIDYKFYPLYIASIPIIFICKPLISISTIPVTSILFIRKLYKKDYRNIFLLALALSCAVFHLIYIKFMVELHIYTTHTPYLDISFSITDILKIINFVVSSIGMSLMGYSFFVINESSYIYMVLSYIIGLSIILYSLSFLIKTYSTKAFLSTSNIIFFFLWISLLSCACADIWNTRYPLYAQHSLYKIDKHHFSRQWWTIFSASIMIYLFLINNHKTKLYNLFDKKSNYHKVFLIAVLATSALFSTHGVFVWARSYCPTSEHDILPSDWKNYISNEIGKECMLANHFPQAIFCKILDHSEHYIKNKDYFSNYISSKKEHDYNFLVARIDTENQLCRNLEIIVNEEQSIQPEFTPNSRFFIFKIDKDNISDKKIRMESNCAKGAWLWLAAKSG